jgi:hypothetical protein
LEPPRKNPLPPRSAELGFVTNLLGPDAVALEATYTKELPGCKINLRDSVRWAGAALGRYGQDGAGIDKHGERPMCKERGHTLRRIPQPICPSSS